MVSLLSVSTTLLVLLAAASSDGFTPVRSYMTPRGLLTADMIKKNRQLAARDIELPAPVQVSSHILRVNQAGHRDQRTGRRFGRHLVVEDGIPVVEGIRVPDDPREKNIVYRNARIINNVLVTDEGETPELNHQVSHSLSVDKGPTSSPVSSTSVNSLSSLAKLVLSSSVKSALRNSNELNGNRLHSLRPTKPARKTQLIQTTFRTPPPLPSYTIQSGSLGRSLQSQNFPLTQRYPIQDARFVPISSSSNFVSQNIDRVYSPTLPSYNSFPPRRRNSFDSTFDQAPWESVNQISNAFQPHWSAKSFTPFHNSKYWHTHQPFNIDPQYSFGDNDARFSSRTGTLAERLSKSQVLTPKKNFQALKAKDNLLRSRQ